MVFTGCGEMADGGGLFHNCFGTHNALIRIDAYLAVGGYRRDE
jgi:hypothetical protein